MEIKELGALMYCSLAGLLHMIMFCVCSLNQKSSVEAPIQYLEVLGP